MYGGFILVILQALELERDSVVVVVVVVVVRTEESQWI